MSKNETHLLGDERFIQRSDEPCWKQLQGSIVRNGDGKKQNHLSKLERGYDECPVWLDHWRS